jgi:hypothetical protein
VAPPVHPAAGFLIPRLAPSVPLAYADGDGGAGWVRKLLTAGLLKPGDRARDIEGHIELGLQRIPAFDELNSGLADLRAYLNDEGALRIEVWGPSYSVGNRINLEPVYLAMLDTRCSQDTMLAVTGVLNSHVLLASPAGWEGVLLNLDEREDVEELHRERYHAQWLKHKLKKGELPDLSELWRKVPQLAEIMRALVETPVPGHDWTWGVTQWRDGCAVSHGWDAEEEVLHNGDLGDIQATFTIEAEGVNDLTEQAVAIVKAIAPINALQSWNWKSSLEITPSAMLCSSTVAEAQLLLPGTMSKTE